MTIHICASRTFFPLSVVDDAMRELVPGTPVRAYGSTLVARRAVLAATSLGLDARNVTLSRERSELVAAGRSPVDAVLCFVAIDPATKAPTEGIGQIMAYLDAQGASYRRIDAPLPGKLCTLLSEHRSLVERALEARNVHQRTLLTGRVLTVNTSVLEERERYEGKLAAGYSIRVGEVEADDRWLLWERCYRAICDELDEAKTLLNGKVAA